MPGRIGLATAVGEYLDIGPDLVAARLDEVGRQVRTALSDVPDWTVAGAGGGAIVSLRPANLTPTSTAPRRRSIGCVRP